MSDQSADRSEFTPAIIYMSGDRRGTTSLLNGPTRNIVLEGKTGVRIERPGGSDDADIVAKLHVVEDHCKLHVEHDHKVWINGRIVSDAQLESGDVLEIGRNGPMLRYRAYNNGIVPRSSMNAVFQDCYDTARFDHGPFLKKARVLVGGVTREFVSRTTLAFRAAVLLSIALIVSAVVFLVHQNRALEARIVHGETQTERLASILAASEGTSITREDLLALRGELKGNLSTAADRIDAIESRFNAAARVVSAAAQSVIFLQGSYGFEHAETGQILRHFVAEEGDTTSLPGRQPVTLGGDGPPVEIQFTGTGFIATSDGVIVTNRHVVRPWEGDDFGEISEAMGLRPVVRRFIGYLPGEAQAFDVDIALVGEAADIALLSCGEITNNLPALSAATGTPRPGDEVIVLGYPTGISAMLARSDQSIMTELASEGGVDFWTIGERLATAGHVSPLATRGIVGQVTPTAVVYDAETTSGGSGGPVLNLDGEVVAVNAAILREFDGSNLGVPIKRAVDLLEELASLH